MYTLILSALCVFFSVNASAALLEVGMSAPHFSLRDNNGLTVKSNELFAKGTTVLFFYPGGPLCRKQMSDYRDRIEQDKTGTIRIVGVTTASLDEIKAKHKDLNLNFPLLTDENGKITELYGAKRWFSVLGPKRITFVIKAGVITKIVSGESVEVHSLDNLELFK